MGGHKAVSDEKRTVRPAQTDPKPPVTIFRVDVRFTSTAVARALVIRRADEPAQVNRNLSVGLLYIAAADAFVRKLSRLLTACFQSLSYRYGANLAYMQSGASGSSARA